MRCKASEGGPEREEGEGACLVIDGVELGEHNAVDQALRRRSGECGAAPVRAGHREGAQARQWRGGLALQHLPLRCAPTSSGGEREQVARIGSGDGQEVDRERTGCGPAAGTNRERTWSGQGVDRERTGSR